MDNGMERYCFFRRKEVQNRQSRWFKYYWIDLRRENVTFSKRVQGGGSVMVWIDFFATCKTIIKFISIRLNSEKYIELLDGFFSLLRVRNLNDHIPSNKTKRPATEPKGPKNTCKRRNTPYEIAIWVA